MSTPQKQHPPHQHSSSSSATMASAALQTPRPVGGASSRRPKLSLQTAIQPNVPSPKISRSAGPGPLTDSPTSRNTQANSKTTLPRAHDSPTSPRYSRSANASPRTLSPLNTKPSSPRGRGTPYVLPLGARPILRNSPLKTPSPSSLGPRSPRRLFVARKRVLFRESLVELMPTPLIEASDSGSDADLPPHAAGGSSLHGEARLPEHPTPIRKSKKQRDWAWTIGADSPGEGKFLRGKDDKPVYPRTPIPEDDEDSEDSTEDSDNDKSPAQIPLPKTPSTSASTKARQVGSS